MLFCRRNRLLLPLIGLIAALTFSACDPVVPPTVNNGAVLGAKAAAAAVTQVGQPYVYGGATPATGFDCSGLTSWAWKQVGVTIPRTSSTQYAGSTRITKAQLRAGDLVFYGTGGVVSHVAMYIGNGNLMQAHKPGVKASIDPLATYWTNALIGYGRVVLPPAPPPA
jgi:cell wall-associated NlpC family hydrolase